MPTPDYYNRLNPNLLTLIPPDAKAILEVGCGAGALAEAYRQINPEVEWTGIERDWKAAKIAESRMTEVIVDDAQSRAENGVMVKEPYVDCLVFGDILEHLANPLEALKGFMLWLKPGGQVLASIPNVQHYSIILGLLRGEWEYADEGLLDRTHLRFFTLKSIKALFADAGLETFEIRGRCINNQGYDEFMAEVGEKIRDEWLGNWMAFANQARTYQYIVRALKPPAEVKPLRIHAIAAEGCCARPRIEEPLRMLGTIPGTRIVIQRSGEAPSETGPPEIVIYQRPSYVDPKVITEIVNQGVFIITEWDDDPRSPYFGDLAASDFLPLRACHAVQVSTEALAEVVRAWNPEVAVFANQIAELPATGWHDRTFADSDCVKIFFGAQNREPDWAPIMPALNRILSEHPKAHMYVVHDRQFFDAIKTREKSFFPFCDYTQYRSILRSCDIALLPLEPTPFNRCKSDLKFLECAAEGVAVLASETVYGETINRFSADMTYGPHYVFPGLLGFLICYPEKRRSFAKASYRYVRDHRLLSQHYRERYEWYQSLINRKESLARALLERAPELARPAHPATRA
jgi:2-polyprenyl-3-methyl-5-hydroxy-6-metoxy-1,4-benzoquinol methylase